MEVGLEKLVLRYGDRVALDRVSLTVPRGQLCVLLGPSGSGKSSLLRALVRLVRPQEGEVRLDGVTIDRKTVKEVRHSIGMIHQDLALVPRASVATNLMTGAMSEMPGWRALLGLYPRAWQERAFAMMLAVDLAPEQLSRRVNQLSGGERQRVAVARAFMRAPRLIIADEPVSSLDPVTAASIMALIRDQARVHGSTVLVSLHQVELARRFADRIVALRDGRIVFDGPPSALDAAAVHSVYRCPQRYEPEAAAA